MAFIIAAVAWIVPSFFLHCLIHEGAHAYVASASGITSKLYPYPQRELGRWTWAAVKFNRPVPGRDAAQVFTAPLVWEAAWFALALIALHFAIRHFPLWGQGILVVEAISALTDMTVWMAGFATMKRGTDAWFMVEVGNFPRWVGLIGLGVLVPVWFFMAGLVWILWPR